MLLLAFVPVGSAQAQDHGMWTVYQHPLKGAKYVDRPFAVGPTSPAWPGFNTAGVRAATAGNAIPGAVEKEACTSGEHGFVATSYVLPTDQYSTQLDPPAHWNERGVLRPAPADSAQSPQGRTNRGARCGPQPKCLPQMCAGPAPPHGRSGAGRDRHTPSEVLRWRPHRSGTRESKRLRIRL
ncbi:hypothetical protein GGP90_001164 [Salinibacter ruber]|uniref:cyclase family protein n=1 Tax=Salinibacter ruber TaxID=146919 RepID=UPI00216A62A9|nr:cyclase family protein [Salinibacter ruber]MCS3756394.1 hypothetical protein [Salinibacter ruber]MCS3954060.1 hypothetical protein [Salinibacter ruber]MCS4087643.1 hypothetical protein [Salinibacter ruber]